MFPQFIDLMHEFYEANSGGNSGGAAAADDQSQQQQEEQQQETFETYVATLPDDIKNKITPLFQAHVADLQSAVKATRKERDDFSKSLRDASKKLDAGSDLQKQVDKMANDLDAANKRADFLEEAPAHDCKNAKAAFALAKANDFFDKHGAPDWKAIQAEAPELFGKSLQQGPRKRSAGNGTKEDQPASQNMNDWIRQQANR